MSVLTSLFPNLFEDYPTASRKGFKVDFKLKDDVQSIFHRAYDMPYALKPKVEEELRVMVETGILNKVNVGKLASPIVVVPKKRKEIFKSMCRFKKNCQSCYWNGLLCPAITWRYIFRAVWKQIIYYSIFKGAYKQLEVNDKSKELLTINTHLGLFKYNRLTYGIFQTVIESIRAGVGR